MSKQFRPRQKRQYQVGEKCSIKTLKWSAGIKKYINQLNEHTTQ